MKLSCKFRYLVALSRLLTEFRTRMSVVGVLLFCRTCHERKSKLPSKMATPRVGIKVLCENVIIKDELTYIVLSIENSSAVSYSMSTPRFVVESKRKTKRGLVYEKQLFPKHTSGKSVTAPGTISRMEFSFDKVTLVKGQVFRIYLYEDGGPRNFVLSFGVSDLR